MADIEQKQFRRLSVNFKALVVVIVLFVIGLIMTGLFSPRPPGIQLHSLVLGALGTTLIAASLVTLMWEVFMRRSFLREILAEVNISENIRDSGIQRVETNFMHVDWKSFYEHGREFKLAIFHATHTLTSNLTYIQSALRKKATFEVVLPDYQNQLLIDNLAKMDGDADSTRIRAKVQDAKDRFCKLGNGNGNGQVSVHLTPNVHPFAIYLNDKTAILVLNREPTFRNAVVLVCSNDGTLYQYACEHFASLDKHSIAAEVVGEHADARETSAQFP